ncbi:hypothetical protein LX36DRAFT_649790 [Colletotrichum falcatum]|nr:hypothetical protein LX36DRAFT_649790 [Colletotrichum falcatum]
MAVACTSSAQISLAELPRLLAIPGIATMACVYQYRSRCVRVAASRPRWADERERAPRVVSSSSSSFFFSAFVILHVVSHSRLGPQAQPNPQQRGGVESWDDVRGMSAVVLASLACG